MGESYIDLSVQSGKVNGGELHGDKRWLAAYRKSRKV